MYKNFLLLFYITLYASTLHAQDWNEIYYLESEAQYLIEDKQYEKAIDVYRRMLREEPKYSLAKFRIGQLYLLTDDQKSRATEYLEEAAQDISLQYNDKSLRETSAPVEVLLYLGEAYQISNRIDDALSTYYKFKDMINPDNKLYPIVVQRIKTCDNAKIALSNPLNVTKQNIGDPINNNDSNFGAVLSGDRKTIIYTSYTSNFLDNYYAVKENGIWSTPKRISEKLSSKYYLKTASLSFDGKLLFLVTDDPDNNNIFVCHKEGDEWTEAEKLPKTINGKKSNETHACISKDGTTLYFTSNREGGFGGKDIYKSTLDAKGNWGEAENMGPNINTEFDEETPFVTMDDKYLFFSSRGHNSIGGFDVFYIDLTSKSTPVNLGYPANTTGDDLFFVPDNSLTSGYISQYDNTSLGKQDIYYVSIVSKITFLASIKDLVKGEKITDSGLNISIIDTETNNIIENINTNNGEIKCELNPGNYSIFINNESYDPYTGQVNIPENYSKKQFTFEALLNPIAIEQEELVAEIVEQAEIEPEKVPGTQIEKEQIVPTVKEFPKEETKVESPLKIEVKEVQPEEKKPEPVIKEKISEKEIVKYVPKTSSESAGTVKKYSIQLMALKNPVEVDYFKNVDNVILTLYPDGLYRYTVGNTESYDEALKLKTKIHELGYTNAFIRIDEVSFTYTIQIMALIIPVEPDHFRDLSSVAVTKSNDYYKYTVGSYNSFEEANQELNNIKSLGYNQAFIKKKD